MVKNLIHNVLALRKTKFKDEIVSMLGLICDPGTSFNSSKAIIEYSYMCCDNIYD